MTIDNSGSWTSSSGTVKDTSRSENNNRWSWERVAILKTQMRISVQTEEGQRVAIYGIWTPSLLLESNREKPGSLLGNWSAIPLTTPEAFSDITFRPTSAEGCNQRGTPRARKCKQVFTVSVCVAEIHP